MIATNQAQKEPRRAGLARGAPSKLRIAHTSIEVQSVLHSLSLGVDGSKHLESLSSLLALFCAYR